MAQKAISNLMLMTRAMMWILPSLNEVIGDIARMREEFIVEPDPWSGTMVYSQIYSPEEIVKKLVGGLTWMPAMAYMREMSVATNMTHDEKKHFSYVHVELARIWLE